MQLSEYAKERFDMFLSALPGWNHGTGVPTTQAHVDEASRLIDAMFALGLEEPSLCMGEGGEIALIWSKGEMVKGSDDLYICIDCFATGEYTAMSCRGDDEFRTGFFAIDSVPEWLVQEIRSTSHA